MYYVYMLTNQIGSVIYTGITNDLSRRINEHKSETVDGFSKRYHTHKLVYYENFSYVNDAISREKQIKGWSRAKKIELIKSKNPDFDDWKFI